MIRHKKENMMTMNQIIGNLSKNIETRIQREIIRKKKKKKKAPGTGGIKSIILTSGQW